MWLLEAVVGPMDLVLVWAVEALEEMGPSEERAE
jgi:hypothetical protein